MSLIASEDYPNKRIYLSVDSVGVDIQPIDIYKEHRTRRRLNNNDERNFPAMIGALGNEQIGAAKFTPRFTNLSSGVKIVPYDSTHALRIKGALISTADQLEGPDLFDRSSLLSTVDIDYQPPQVEIITVATGGALTTQQAGQLSGLAATLEESGVFREAALANAPGGSGGDDAQTIYNLFTDGNNADPFKADVSGLSTFDPASDTVANVATVETVTDPVTVGGAGGGFESSDRTALLAIAYGRQTINYSNSTFTQFDAAGNVVQVFDLRDAIGNPAQSPQTAVERIPQ